MLDCVVPLIMHIGIACVLFRDDTLDIPNDLDIPLRFMDFVIEDANC